MDIHESVLIEGEVYGVVGILDNYGTLEVYGGSIVNSNASGYAISNGGTAYVAAGATTTPANYGTILPLT